MAKTCNSCGADNQKTNVPYVVHEAMVARQERQIKRMWITLIVAVALIFASNAIWLYYSSYIGQDGNIYNGENNSAETQED